MIQNKQKVQSASSLLTTGPSPASVISKTRAFWEEGDANLDRADASRWGDCRKPIGFPLVLMSVEVISCTDLCIRDERDPSSDRQAVVIHKCGVSPILSVPAGAVSSDKTPIRPLLSSSLSVLRRWTEKNKQKNSSWENLRFRFPSDIPEVLKRYLGKFDTFLMSVTVITVIGNLGHEKLRCQCQSSHFFWISVMSVNHVCNQRFFMFPFLGLTFWLNNKIIQEWQGCFLWGSTRHVTTISSRYTDFSNFRLSVGVTTSSPIQPVYHRSPTVSSLTLIHPRSYLTHGIHDFPVLPMKPTQVHKYQVHKYELVCPH
jgi:hypothetical protein